MSEESEDLDNQIRKGNEELEERRREKGDYVTIVNGKERMGMSSMGIKMGEYVK